MKNVDLRHRLSLLKKFDDQHEMSIVNQQFSRKKAVDNDNKSKTSKVKGLWHLLKYSSNTRKATKSNKKLPRQQNRSRR